MNHSVYIPSVYLRYRYNIIVYWYSGEMEECCSDHLASVMQLLIMLWRAAHYNSVLCYSRVRIILSYAAAVLPRRPTAIAAAAAAAKPAEKTIVATSTRGRCSAFLSLEPILPNASDAHRSIIILLRSRYVSRTRRRRCHRGHVGHLCRSVHVITTCMVYRYRRTVKLPYYNIITKSRGGGGHKLQKFVLKRISSNRIEQIWF